jgi:hypothetical protein
MAALGRCALLSSWERMPGSNVRLRLVRICSAVAIAAIAAACSFTTSLDGFSNGPTDDGGSLGEAANGTDASMVDGDAGSVVTDASIGVEAGGDGGFPFCAAHASAVFCADFERDPINAGWFDTLNANAGRDGRGIACRVPARGGTSSSNRPSAAFHGPVAIVARQPFTLAFDMNIAVASGGGVLDIGGFHYSGLFYVATLRMQDDGTVSVHEFGDPFMGAPQVLADYPLILQPGIGRWVRVEMKVTFPVSNDVHLIVTFDGALAYDGKLSAAPYASQPYLFGGIGNAENAGQARTIGFDDVLITTP